MRNFLLIVVALFLLGVPTFAQTDSTSKTSSAQADEEKPKRQIFRAKKDIVNNHS